MLTQLHLATGIQSCENMCVYRLRRCSNVVCSYFIRKIIIVNPFAGEAKDGNNGELEILGVFKIH